MSAATPDPATVAEIVSLTTGKCFDWGQDGGQGLFGIAALLAAVAQELTETAEVVQGEAVEEARDD